MKWELQRCRVEGGDEEGRANAPLLDELRRPVSVDLEGVTPQRTLKVLVGLWTLVYSFSKTVHSRDKITHDETSHGPAHTLVFLAGAFAASSMLGVPARFWSMLLTQIFWVALICGSI